MPDPLLALLVLLVIVLLALAIGRALVTVTIVHDHERGLRYRGGRLTGLLGAGTYLSVRPMSEVHVLDVRPAFIVVEGQEVLTADGVAAKVSLAARYVVADAAAAITRDADFRRTMYLLLQLALRDSIGRRTLDEALAVRREIGAELREACADRLAAIGIELLEVDVRDVMLPGELKRAYAGVTSARKDGEAALERARAETAALRNLANAGRMVDDNPGLLQLRILQELGSSAGSTVVFGAPDAAGRPAAAPGRPAASPRPGLAPERPAASPRAGGARSGRTRGSEGDGDQPR